MLARQSRASFLFAVSSLIIPVSGHGQTAAVPASVKALEKHGVTIMQEFDAGKNIKAFAGMAGNQPVAIYVLPDGNAIAGTRLDDKGEPMDEATLQKLVAKPIGNQEWSKLEKSTWVLDGKDSAPRIIYMFSDANCPYCHQFSEAARPWVDAGKVQIRHLLVGVIKADSPAKAAAILEAKDRTAALQENERTYDQGGIKPLKKIPAEIKKIIDDNQTLMFSMGFRGTPSISIRDPDGLVQKYNGMPRPNDMAEVLGPR